MVSAIPKKNTEAISNEIRVILSKDKLSDQDKFQLKNYEKQCKNNISKSNDIDVLRDSYFCLALLAVIRLNVQEMKHYIGKMRSVVGDSDFVIINEIIMYLNIGLINEAFELSIKRETLLLRDPDDAFLLLTAFSRNLFYEISLKILEKFNSLKSDKDFLNSSKLVPEKLIQIEKDFYKIKEFFDKKNISNQELVERIEMIFSKIHSIMKKPIGKFSYILYINQDDYDQSEFISFQLLLPLTVEEIVQLEFEVTRALTEEFLNESFNEIFIFSFGCQNEL